jgi:Putative transmembrane protein (PGPGW)
VQVWVTTKFEVADTSAASTQSNENLANFAGSGYTRSMTRLIDKVLCFFGVGSCLRVRKLFVAVVGMTVLLIGLALLILPGPAFVVIPVGLAILATEFVWARRWLDKVRDWFNKAKGKLVKQPK